MIETEEGTHGVVDILLGFEPKDAGSIPAGSVNLLGCVSHAPEQSLHEPDIRLTAFPDLDGWKEQSGIGHVVRRGAYPDQVFARRERPEIEPCRNPVSPRDAG